MQSRQRKQDACTRTHCQCVSVSWPTTTWLPKKQELNDLIFLIFFSPTDGSKSSLEKLHDKIVLFRAQIFHTCVRPIFHGRHALALFSLWFRILMLGSWRPKIPCHRARKHASFSARFFNKDPKAIATELQHHDISEGVSVCCGTKRVSLARSAIDDEKCRQWSAMPSCVSERVLRHKEIMDAID